MAHLVERAAAGDMAGARAEHVRLSTWMHAAFVESNPIPVKAALALQRRIQNVLRLPLVPLRDDLLQTVRLALIDAGALKA
jgi:4-hydroxy-tetrahydrodipicolinate synthase